MGVIISTIYTSVCSHSPEGAVCTRQASRQVMYTVENRRKRDRSSGMWGYLGMWDVIGVKTARNPRSLQTVYATEYFIDYECCVGWNRIGDTCQADCYSPCEHGLCVDTNVCVCDEGWEGQQCEHDVDECWYETDECDRENGACTNTEGSYNCTCNDGLHLINGTVCHEIPDTDECTTDSGGCDQNCHNTHGSYYCTCDAGYTLAADRHTCTDTPVQVSTHGPYYCTCDAGYTLAADRHTCTGYILAADRRTCTDTPVQVSTHNSYVCTCDAGYTLAADRHTCTGYTLAADRHTCTDTPVQVSTHGSYYCTCDAGYTLAADRHTCTDTPVQVSTHGSYYCTCDAGYTLAADRHTCTDTPVQVSTHGSYYCTCDAGYTLAADRHTCTDTPVQVSTHGSYYCTCDAVYILAADRHTCTDTPVQVSTHGPYYCTCDAGYTLAADRQTCTDTPVQVSTHGSYYCTCDAGYTLAADRHTCTDTPVQVSTHGPYYCTCDAGYTLAVERHTCTGYTLAADRHTCTDTPVQVSTHNTYYCTCDAGYILAADRHTCTDTPVQVSTHGSHYCTCDAGYTLAADRHTCTDTPVQVSIHGSYYCTCDAGYILAADRHTCTDTPVQVSTHGSYYCTCDAGYTLAADRHTCTDTPVQVSTHGSYYCTCDAGYTLAADRHTCTDTPVQVSTHGSYYCTCDAGYILAADRHNCTDTPVQVSTHGSYYCTCDAGYILAAERHTCTDIPVQVSTHGSYYCTCDAGYTLAVERHTCTEVNDLLADAPPPSVSRPNADVVPPQAAQIAMRGNRFETTSRSGLGSRRFQCDLERSNGATLNLLRDINECATNNGGCEHFCRNVPGGRACSCRNNHRLVDGHVCRDDDMYPYGEEAGETPRRWDFSTCTEESLPQEGFRFFGRRHHEIHICDNGIVSFDRINRPRNPVLIQNTFGFRKAAVLVPFLARSNASHERTKIYYSFYERGDGKNATDEVLERAREDGRSIPLYFSPTYEPVWALVVTWTRVPPDCGMYAGGVCPRPHDQLPVSPAAGNMPLSTTLRFVALRPLRPQPISARSYSTILILQVIATSPVPDEAREGGTRKCPKAGGTIAVGGYSAGDGTGPYPYTPATNSSLVYSDRDFSGQDCTRQRLSPATEVSMRYLYQVYGGNWKFALQSQETTAVPESAVVECSQWMREQIVEDPTELLGYSALPPVFSCPCSAEQAFYDPTYTVDSSQFGQSRFCARSRRRVHTLVGAEKLIMSRSCCYSTAYWWRQWGRIERFRRRRLGRNRIGGGTLLTGHAGGHLIIASTSKNDQAADEAAYQSCCVGASGTRDGWYCQRFQTLRPLTAPSAPGCQNYPQGTSGTRYTDTWHSLHKHLVPATRTPGIRYTDTWHPLHGHLALTTQTPGTRYTDTWHSLHKHLVPATRTPGTRYTNTWYPLHGHLTSAARKPGTRYTET
ncbi:hypothetical protein Bbelb_132950 [Branchiostoma belcheri]|nr:hypothetical protein Bbelb_132950 [Branchiostoma belcheri]